MKNVEYAFKSYIGSQDRENSESYIHINNLFMVVDGLGIDSLAEIAKEQTCRIVPDAFFRHLSENKSPADALVHAVEEANKRIIEERQKLGEKIAASISLAYVFGKIMYFAHLGDSRIYSFQAGELNQLTKDHTIKEDDPLAEKKYDDPRALQALTQGLGLHEKPVVQIKQYPLDKRCLIIMTNTGLTERVSNREIAWISKKLKRPEKIVRALIDLNKRKGGNGNLTIGIIKCGGLTKWMRKVLMIYSVFFLVLMMIIGGYSLNHGTKDQKIDKLVIVQPLVQKKTPDVVKTEAGKNSLQGKDKVAAVKPVIQKKIPDSTEKESENKTLSAKPAEKGKKDESPVMESAAGDIGADLFDDANDFIIKWKNAWEKTAGDKGDINKYMSFYSDKFMSDGFNKKTWRIDKETKNKRKEWITIKVSDVKISGPTKENRIEVRFIMQFKSSNFIGSSRKLLTIIKEGKALKIIGERNY